MKKSFGAKTLLFPTPVLIVGTYDHDGMPNVMNAAWGGVCCSKPPCLSVSIRRATHTFSSIMENGAFTVSIPSRKYLEEADYFGIASGEKVNKFEKTGLTPVKSDLVNAPYVGEFPVILECKLVHDYELGLHTMFVGEILDVKADESVIDEETGLPSLEKIEAIAYDTASKAYNAIGEKLAPAFNAGLKYN